jgi:hypothetical protein
MENPPRQGSNFLEYNPAKEVLSQGAWKTNSAEKAFYKLPSGENMRKIHTIF